MTPLGIRNEQDQLYEGNAGTIMKPITTNFHGYLVLRCVIRSNAWIWGNYYVRVSPGHLCYAMTIDRLWQLMLAKKLPVDHDLINFAGEIPSSLLQEPLPLGMEKWWIGGNTRMLTRNGEGSQFTETDVSELAWRCAKNIVKLIEKIHGKPLITVEEGRLVKHV